MRILAKLLVMFNKYASAQFIKKIIPDRWHDYFDVEGIFYKLKVERELENILVINEMINLGLIKRYIDIGANYGQFASSVQIEPSNKFLVEPNPVLRRKIVEANPGALIYDCGLVDTGEGALDFLLVQGNTGASRVLNDGEIVSGTDKLIKVNMISVESFCGKIGVDKLSESFIKIDIEGREISIIDAFNSCLPKSIRPIYAFETLVAKHVNDAMALLEGYVYFSARFSYQGDGDRNYGSVLKLINVIIKGSDTLNFIELTQKSISREFYSLVFCIPMEHQSLLSGGFTSR